MSVRKYNVVSLFSGAMGLDIGLEQTGRFRTRACVEVEPSFCDTIRRNKESGILADDLLVYETDICGLEPTDVLKDIKLRPGEVDLLVGGPPCQSFSTVGRRGTVQDPRGTLLWQFLRFVRIMRPRFFLMENVRGLLSAALQHRKLAERPDKGGPPLQPEEEPGSVVELFANDLQSLGDTSYHLDVFEVNAVNYGAPQLRERVLFVGNRYNAATDFLSPTHGQPDSHVDPQVGLFDDKQTPLKPWATLGEAIADLDDPEPQLMDFSPRKKKFLGLVPEGSNWRSLPVELQKESMGRAWHAKGGRSGWWRRLTFDLPCPTLVTMPNHASTSLCHPIETRALTVREYARIQEFPNGYKFCGKVSQQYAQIGNAVPIRLGRVAGDILSKAMDQLVARRWQPYKLAKEHYRVVYVQSHVRTRRWFKNGKVYTWKDGSDNGDNRYGSPKTKHSVRKL